MCASSLEAPRFDTLEDAMQRESVEQAIAHAETIAARGPKFAAHAEALAFLELHVLDRTIPPDLQAMVSSLQNRLEQANQKIVADVRSRIVSKALRGADLARTLVDHAGPPNDDVGYDALDLLLGMILDAGDPNARVSLDHEMVAYQPTPARAILDAVGRAQISERDRFCDLGSGLGWVVMLVALITKARCSGIELEPAYVEASRRCARELSVENVSFTCADLLHADLSEATTFFSYTPLRGDLLQKLIARLHEEARRRPIRICSLGPCTKDFSEAKWLTRATDDAIDEAEIALFHSAL